MKIDSFSIEGKHNSNEDSLSVLQIIDDKIIAVLADGRSRCCRLYRR